MGCETGAAVTRLADVGVTWIPGVIGRYRSRNRRSRNAWVMHLTIVRAQHGVRSHLLRFRLF